MVEIQNLSKKYGGREALKSISLSIQKGEFYGLLGPNGAGKTTTISILSSILKPDAGEVLIDEKNLTTQSNLIKKLIGIVPQEIALYNELSAVENLLFWGSMYDIEKYKLTQRISNMLDLFGLTERKSDQVGSYSGGMKRRINIAAALLHQPKVLLMDEPTVGIDPQSRNLIFEVIKKLHQDGLTIIYTTHYMEEAERLCDRIGIIDNGEIVAQGTVDELKSSSALKEIIKVTFNQINESLFNKLSDFWKDIKLLDAAAYFYSSDIKADLSKIVLECNQLGAEITHIEIQKINLESIFLNLTGKQLRD